VIQKPEETQMNTKLVSALLLVMLAVLLLAACTGGPNPLEGTAVPGDDEPAGFLAGIIHGGLSPLFFFMSLIDDEVNIYEVHNKGWEYDLGFVLAAGILGGGLFGSRRRS